MTGQLERRTFVAEVPRDLMAAVDLRDEELRLAQFLYSRTVRSGDKPSFYYVQTTHETEQ